MTSRLRKQTYPSHQMTRHKTSQRKETLLPFLSNFFGDQYLFVDWGIKQASSQRNGSLVHGCE